VKLGGLVPRPGRVLLLSPSRTHFRVNHGVTPSSYLRVHVTIAGGPRIVVVAENVFCFSHSSVEFHFVDVVDSRELNFFILRIGMRNVPDRDILAIKRDVNEALEEEVEERVSS